MTTKHETAFKKRTDLKQYGANARLLFALETRFNLEDVHTVAADALTDGPDDKKCDLVYLETERGELVIAQAYEATRTKKHAPSNKAADLSTAVNWLIAQPLEKLPVRLVPAATMLRRALENKEIASIQVWFVHNLRESTNVAKELQSVERLARDLVAQHYPMSDVEQFSALEVGTSSLEEWYHALEAPILVAEVITVDIPGAYELKGEDWHAVITAVPASWLHELWIEHGSHLLSANVRDYLGSRRSVKNVNNGIKTTAQDDPDHFWTFNNGITALTHDFSVVTSGKGTSAKRTLTLKGLSIVNGAQTTGAVGSLSEKPKAAALVQARFVRCTSTETIKDIIQYNNTQNSVRPTDFRSNDGVQRRLRKEFESIPQAKYLGGRRGGRSDKIGRPPNLLPTDTCSQALAAVHQDPAIAYHRKSQIWESDKHYSRFFSDHTHAAHIVFCMGLLRAIEAKKVELVAMQSEDSKLSETDEEVLGFLRRRGSAFLATAAIARCLETFLGRAVPNAFRLSFGPTTCPEDAKSHWRPIVDSVFPFCSHLSPAVDTGLENSEAVMSAVREFKRMVEATKVANAKQFRTFKQRVKETG